LDPQLFYRKGFLKILDLRNNSCVDEKIDPPDYRSINRKLKKCLNNLVIASSTKFDELENSVNLVRSDSKELEKHVLAVKNFMKDPEKEMEGDGPVDLDKTGVVRREPLKATKFVFQNSSLESMEQSFSKIKSKTIDSNPIYAMFIVVTIILIVSILALLIYIITFCILK
jgi:hypothetical protein